MALGTGPCKKPSPAALVCRRGFFHLASDHGAEAATPLDTPGRLSLGGSIDSRPPKTSWVAMCLGLADRYLTTGSPPEVSTQGQVHQMQTTSYLFSDVRGFLMQGKRCIGDRQGHPLRPVAIAGDCCLACKATRRRNWCSFQTIRPKWPIHSVTNLLELCSLNPFSPERHSARMPRTLEAHANDAVRCWP